VRRGHGERGGDFGGDGSSGGASAAAKTSELGHDDESPAEVLEAVWREATLQPRSWWDLDTTWGPAKPLQWATEVGTPLIPLRRKSKNCAAQTYSTVHESLRVSFMKHVEKK